MKLKFVIPLFALLISIQACSPGSAQSAATHTLQSTSSPLSTQPSKISAANGADMVFVNGNIITMDDSNPSAQAIAIQENKILGVGTNEEISQLQGANTVRIDLDGKTVTPGFIDSHQYRIQKYSLVGFTDATASVERAIEQGYTSLDELYVEQALLDELIRLDRDGRLRVRVNAYLPIMQYDAEGTSLGDWYEQYTQGQVLSPHVRVGGIIGFVDFDNARVLLFQQDELNDFLLNAQQEGWRVALKVAGTRPMEMILDAYDDVRSKDPSVIHARGQLEHALFMLPEQIQRVKALGLIPVINLNNPGQLVGEADIDEFISREPQGSYSPWRNLVEAGVLVANGSGWPSYYVDEPSGAPFGSPLHLIYQAVTRVGSLGQQPYPWLLDQTITAEEALRMLTINGAYTTFEEDTKGSLAAGKLADLVILSDDPLSVPVEQINNIRVLMTMIDGKVEYCAAGSEEFCPGPLPSSSASPSHTASNSFRILSGCHRLPVPFGCPASNAIDGDPDTVWNSGNHAEQWIQIDLYAYRRPGSCRETPPLPMGNSHFEIRNSKFEIRNLKFENSPPLQFRWNAAVDLLGYNAFLGRRIQPSSIIASGLAKWHKDGLMSSVEEIKARLDIVDLVGETVNLRRSGKNYTGFCPFHSNTRTPSFVVFPDTGTWRCFGQCNEGGDIFKFVMKKEGWDFPEALRRLAERAGVQLRAPSPLEAAAKEQNARLREALEEAFVYCHHQLMHTDAGKPTLDYLHHRGITDASIESFGLGYAPDSYDALSIHLQSHNVTFDEMRDAGLLSTRDDGSHYDRFRHRLMIPIRDAGGRVAGFGARALRDEDQPKYLNSPQTALFDKGSLLYGLDKARKAIRNEDQVVIVEGYLDVIALHQAGYANAVSPMGTALGEGQLRQLKRLSKRMVLALDADAAGDKATLRGLEVARQSLDRAPEPVFDARGLLHQEGRLQADIRVSTLPEGQDPDEIVIKDPAAWPKILNEAKPIVEHVMLSLAKGRDLNDAKVKRELAGQVLPLINDIPSAIERDSYIQKLSHLLHVSENSLLSERPVKRRAPLRRRMVTTAIPKDWASKANIEDSVYKLESHITGIILRTPELLYRLDRELQQAGLPRLSSADFENSDMQEMFRLSLEGLEQDLLEPSSYALQNLPLPLLDLADELLVSSEELDPNAERVFADLLRSILLLRRRALHKNTEQMRFLQEDAQESGDLKASEYQQVMLQNIVTLQRLDKALAPGRQLPTAQ